MRVPFERMKRVEAQALAARLNEALAGVTMNGDDSGLFALDGDMQPTVSVDDARWLVNRVVSPFGTVMSVAKITAGGVLTPLVSYDPEDAEVVH